MNEKVSFAQIPWGTVITSLCGKIGLCVLQEQWKGQHSGKGTWHELKLGEVNSGHFMQGL